MWKYLEVTIELALMLFQPNVPLFRGFRARFLAFWRGKRTRSGTAALPD